MNDLIKIYGFVALRYIIVAICTHLGIEKAQQDSLLTPEALGLLRTAITTIGYGIYRTLVTKLRQRTAQTLPANVSEDRVKQMVNDMPLSAKLTATPTK